MRNEEIMMRPKGGKKKRKKKRRLVRGNQVIVFWSFSPWEALQRNMMEWMGRGGEGERGEDHPPPYPMGSSPPPRAQAEPARFPGELRVPLITVNTNFNERLRRPRSCFCGQMCCSPTYLGASALDLNTISDTSLSSTLIDSQNAPSLSDQSPLAGVHQLSVQYFLFNDASPLHVCVSSFLMLPWCTTMKGGTGS